MTMKSKTIGLRIAGCFFIAIIMVSCKSKDKLRPPKGFEKVEAPKEAYSQLKNPQPIQAKQNVSADKVQIRGHNFLFIVDGKPFSGDLVQSGEVSKVSDKELVIKSTEKGELTMRYSLPGNLTIPVKIGEKLSVDYRKRFYENSIGYTLTNYAGDQFVHASCKISNADTIRVALSKGIFIYQALGQKVEEKKSDFGIVRDIPVYLNINGRNTLLTPGKEQEVDINNVKFTVFVIVSTQMQSSEEKRSSSEGDGFTLEYAIVKK